MEEAHFTEEIRSEYYAQEAEELPEDAYPLSYELFGKHQSRDKAILTETKKSNSRYAIKTYTGLDILESIGQKNLLDNTFGGQK